MGHPVMEKAAIAGGFFKVPMLWGLASSGHTRTYKYETINDMAEGQDGFAYTEKQVEWLLHCISRERMQPYFIRARGDQWVAFHLYIRNTEISSALYGIVQALEIGLRNVVHSRLTETYGTEEWWFKLPLHAGELNDIEEAKANISQRLKEVRPGRVVAELGLGFWVKLFANTYEKEIWVPQTSRVFPAKLSRKVLHDRLTELKTLRNRIAHHETLIKRDPAADYSNLLETIGWIAPTLRKWVESQSDFAAVFAKPIPKRPKV
jgi:hypothetical protein